MSESESFCPLQGVRVLDLSRYLPGPLMTRALADLGAEVIKVEPPTGEGLRWMHPRVGGIGAAFGGLNAGKDSVAVDLKKPEGVAFIEAMLGSVDVLVEAFRPGKLGALGLDPQELLERFPRLIICSLSGFGQTGSMAQVAGHDLNYVAHAGVLGLFGPAGRPPGVPGVQIGDVGGGSLPAAMGVLAALLERQRTGRGRHLDISLTRGAVAFGGIAFAQAATGFVEERGAGFLTGGAPCCRCFETRDGRFVAFSALEPHFFATFCNLVDRPDLSRKGYARGEEAAQVAAELAAVFAERDLAAWLELADGEDVCLTAVRTAAEAMADPEFASVVRQVDGHTVVTTHVGVDLPTPSRGPSELGADVAAVVERLGLPEAVVQAARQSGALVWSE